MSGASSLAEGLTGPFWEAASERRLVRPYCPSCERSFFTPQVVCPFCQSASWHWEASSGRGAVYSFTEVHRAPVDGFVTPYVIGVIDFDEGWTMVGTIVESAAEVAIGRPVELRWIESGGRVVPAFSVAA